MDKQYQDTGQMHHMPYDEPNVANMINTHTNKSNFGKPVLSEAIQT